MTSVFGSDNFIYIDISQGCYNNIVAETYLYRNVLTYYEWHTGIDDTVWIVVLGNRKVT